MYSAEPSPRQTEWKKEGKNKWKAEVVHLEWDKIQGLAARKVFSANLVWNSKFDPSWTVKATTLS